mmetsp:Transcript_133922/g.189284  ORF Transcript_133922/g.189284 Transcript_133922/m.189284 type:complete len:98 (+) Transcript_133922:155-448(+)
MILGVILVASELGVGYVLRNFGLLKEAAGRGLYLIFLGTLMFDNKVSFQLLASILCVICGFGYVVMDLGDRTKMYYIQNNVENIQKRNNNNNNGGKP